MRQESFSALVKSDIKAFAARSPRKGWYLIAPGFWFVLGERLVKVCGRVPLVGKPLRRIVWLIHGLVFGSEIALGANIGGGFYVPHPHGIVIGPGARIGRNVTILHGVTVGMKSLRDPAIGMIEDDVYIGVGAVIIGGVTVGRGAVVGANAVVVKDVPPGATAVGNPARILSPKTAADQSTSRGGKTRSSGSIA